MTLLSSAFILALSAGSVALAQDDTRVSRITGQPAAGASRIEAGLSFAQSFSGSTFSTTQTIPEYAENGTLTSSYKVKAAPGAAVHVQYNVSEKLGVRLGAQASSRKSDGTFSGQVPHPFFFNRQRPFSGSQNDLGFSEVAYSLTAVLRGGSGKWSFALEGGPAYFSVNATLAEKARITEIYPYDTVTIDGASTAKKKVSPIGLAVGAEFGRALNHAVSVVAQARYTGGTGSVDLGGQSVDIKAGGAQARIGLRVTVARRRPVS